MKLSNNALMGIIITLLVFVIFANWFGGPTGYSVKDQFVRYDVSTEGSPFIGDPNAPVTLVEFGDFQCGYCRSFYFDSIPLLKEKYIDTGKVKLVFRNFPKVNKHPHALIAAQYAACADTQGLFWEMHDKIYDNQNLLSEEQLAKWADEIGVEVTPSCLEKPIEKINRDFSEAVDMGVEGTPSIFINGVPMYGLYPYEAYERVIEIELS